MPGHHLKTHTTLIYPTPTPHKHHTPFLSYLPQTEDLASLRLEAGASKAGAEGVDALAADHRAEAATNRAEVALIESILRAQVKWASVDVG